MSRLESSIENAAVSKIHQVFGVKGLKFSVKGENGHPDRLFPIPGGRPVLMEFKKPGQKLRPLQTYRCDQWEKLGYWVVRGVTSVEEAVGAIAFYMERVSE